MPRRCTIRGEIDELVYPNSCYWPISFQRCYIPQLRHVSEDALSDETKQKLAMSGKCWGVVFILLCSYLVYVTSAAVS